VTVNLADYEGVSTNQAEEADFWDWMIFIALLGMGCFPALLWWYLVMHRVTYQVALTNDHGYAARVLYRGGNHDRVIEIAETIRDVTGLFYDGS
jgi:hypothetical protein